MELRNPCRMLTVFAIAGSTDKRAMACLMLKENQRLCNDMETQTYLSGPAFTTGHTLARCKGPPQMTQGVVISFTSFGFLLDVELLADMVRFTLAWSLDLGVLDTKVWGCPLVRWDNPREARLASMACIAIRRAFLGSLDSVISMRL